MDKPQTIVEVSMENHYTMLIQLNGVRLVDAGRFADVQIKHLCSFLVGGPIMLMNFLKWCMKRRFLPFM